MISKKGQILTIITIFLIAATFTSIAIYTNIQERNIIKTRVSTMDSFLDSTEKNLERQIYIAGYRIIFLATNQVITNAKYVDVDGFLQEAFFNGTVNGIEDPLLVGANYKDIIESINQNAEKINTQILLENPTIEFSQDNPWSIKVTFTADLLFKDSSQMAEWNRKQVITTYVPIKGFEDPLFAINTYNKISRVINRTIYSNNYSSINLLDHIQMNYYEENNFAPNFLMRLEGNLSSDPQGIESFVNIPELTAQNLETESKSVVDYIYFSQRDPSSYDVPGLPSWFKIDEEDNHSEIYNL